MSGRSPRDRGASRGGPLHRARKPGEASSGLAGEPLEQTAAGFSNRSLKDVMDFPLERRSLAPAACRGPSYSGVAGRCKLRTSLPLPAFEFSALLPCGTLLESSSGGHV